MNKFIIWTAIACVGFIIFILFAPLYQMFQTINLGVVAPVADNIAATYAVNDTYVYGYGDLQGAAVGNLWIIALGVLIIGLVYIGIQRSKGNDND